MKYIGGAIAIDQTTNYAFTKVNGVYWSSPIKSDGSVNLHFCYWREALPSDFHDEHSEARIERILRGC